MADGMYLNNMTLCSVYVCVSVFMCVYLHVALYEIIFTLA